MEKNGWRDINIIDSYFKVDVGCGMLKFVFF